MTGRSATGAVILLGGGGHTRVLLDSLLLSGCPPLGYAAPAAGCVEGVPWLGSDEAILKRLPHECQLVNGVGSVGDVRIRRELFERFRSLGYSFRSVVHPSAVISPTAILGEGVQIMAKAVIQTGVWIGDNTIINTASCVDHDCQIGAHVHIAPGATLSGGVRVEDQAHVGTGATVIQGIRLGRGCVVGAGAVVVRDVPPGQTVIGVPAKGVSVK